jgi:hypothetical protein
VESYTERKAVFYFLLEKLAIQSLTNDLANNYYTEETEENMEKYVHIDQLMMKHCF